MHSVGSQWRGAVLRVRGGGGGGGGGNSHEVYYSFSLKVQLYMKT